MKHNIRKSNYRLNIKQSICILIIVTFLSVQICPITHAQSVLNLPAPGTMITTSPAFNPPIMRGISIDPQNPFQFDFIIDVGDEKLKDESLKEESTKLIKYFLASLTVPEDEMWVNLSPYEKDRIIPNSFGQTEMGRDLLAQDYMLKQLTASLMYPEEDLGNEFWNKVYEKATRLYGTTEIPVNTFNKVWIVPEKAVVYANGTNVFVLDSRFKVMLEEDYLALDSNVGSTKHGLGDITKDEIESINGVSSEIIRELLIPEIEKEVNEGKNFAKLRQIYNSMILATWYKKNLKKGLLGQLYVDKSKTKGIDLKDDEINQKIYSQYVEAFERGVFDFIKEDYDETTQEIIPRKYFSGGADLGKVDSAMLSINNDGASSTIQKTSRFKSWMKRLAAASLVTLGVTLAVFLHDSDEKIMITLDDSIDRTVEEVMETVSYFDWRIMGTMNNLKTAQFINNNLTGYYDPKSEPIRQVDKPSVFYREIPEIGPVYVAATVPGSLGSEGRHIVFTAHFDATDRGADDNTSGVSALLAIARVVAKYNFKDNVYFLFTNDEEYGKLGSRVAIKDFQNLGIEKNNVVFINIDAIGQSHLQSLSLSQEQKKPQIWITTPIVDETEEYKSQLLEVETLPALSLNPPFPLESDTNTVSIQSLPSDAAVYRLYGYPSITISGIRWEDASTAAILNTSEDTADKVSLEKVGEIAKWILTSLEEIARVEGDIDLDTRIEYVSLTSAGLDFIEQNYLEDTKTLFEQYDLTFESRHAVSESGYNMLSKWLEFISKKFPYYRKHFKGVEYDLSKRIAHADGDRKIIEFGFPLKSRALWLPYGYLSKYGVWYAASDVVLTHELGHFVSEDGLRKKGINLYMAGEIGDLHKPEEMFATDFALWFLYQSVRDAPDRFIDSYLHGDYNFETGELKTTILSEHRSIIPFEARRRELVEQAAK